MGALSKLELVSGATRLDISDVANFSWMGYAGFGMAQLHRLVMRGPQQSGETDMGYLLEPRMIQLTIGIMGTYDNVFTKQNQLLNMCSPSNNAIGLCFTRINAGVASQIDVFPVGGLDFASSERGPRHVISQLSLRAPDPTWYDPTPGYLGFGLGGGAGAWQIPWAIPWAIGASTINISSPIIYPGTADSYFYGTITGPITNAIITFTDGVSTYTLDFTGVTINAGDVRVIDTRYPMKTIVNSSAVNKNGDLTTASNLANIVIAKCLPGETTHTTTVTVTGSSINAATRVDINYYNRYNAAR